MPRKKQHTVEELEQMLAAERAKAQKHYRYRANYRKTLTIQNEMLVDQFINMPHPANLEAQIRSLVASDDVLMGMFRDDYHKHIANRRRQDRRLHDRLSLVHEPTHEDIIGNAMANDDLNDRLQMYAHQWQSFYNYVVFPAIKKSGSRYENSRYHRTVQSNPADCDYMLKMNRDQLVKRLDKLVMEDDWHAHDIMQTVHLSFKQFDDQAIRFMYANSMQKNKPTKAPAFNW